MLSPIALMITQCFEAAAPVAATSWLTAFFRALTLQHFFQNRERAGIARAAQRLHRPLAHIRIPALFCDVNQRGNALAVRHGLQRRYGSLLHLHVGVVISDRDRKSN